MSASSLKVLLAPQGSSGDVHPMVAVGRALKTRGHQIVVIGNDYFEPLHRTYGFDFVPTGTFEEYKKLIAHPDLWHPRRGFGLLSREMMIPETRVIYERILEQYEPGRTVVVAPTIAFGARFAQERHNVPLVTALIQPSMLRSEYEMPRLPGMPAMNHYPRWAKRLLYWLADTIAVDPTLAKPLNEFRKEIGLPPARRFLAERVFSTDAILALYPDWFFPRQPDWPPHYITSDFPRYDETGVALIPPETEEFIAAGEPPIVFTFGSANEQATKPLRAALEALQRLKRRGMFIARSSENLPQPLPPTVHHAAYLPFSWIFPRAAAVVHHGGIGTTAQAMAAGVPQIIMPMGFDQFDSADRVRKLGVGEELRPQQFTGPNIAAVLQRLLTKPETAVACKIVQDRLAGPADFGVICETIERVGRRAAEPGRTERAAR